LLIGIPIALVLAVLAAFVLAGAALRPVESMRRRAATISGSDLSRRLPLPTSRDEINRLGATLNEMLDRIEEGLSRERAFVADASHELRMPLAVLRAELEVALREHGDVGQLRTAIGSAVEETDRISRLAEDLLLLARADHGRLPIECHPIAVDELLTEVAARFAPAVGHAARTLAIGNAAGEVELWADVDRLHQALGNLIDNALAYGRGAITLDACLGDGCVELHVTDHGAGFDERFLTGAFDRFTREDRARRRGGSGLGLAIVRTIARAHGGDAHAANRGGGGADLWMTVPTVAGRTLGKEPADASERAARVTEFH
jgi:signal transduction histidine kinase